MAATVDYQVTTAGAAKVVHNGRVVYSGRKVALDPTDAATQALLARGLITATLTGNPKYHDDAANLQTYTVQAAGAGKILHTTAAPGTTGALAQGATLQLDPMDANTATFIAKGWIA